MNSPTPVPVALPAIPFWKSPVVLGIIVAALSALAAKFKLQAYITSGNVTDIAGYVLEGLSAVSAYVALHARVFSSVQPVTLTQGGADTKNTQSGFARVGLLVSLVLMLVAGCAALGIAQPKTFAQQYATGVAACTTAITTTDTLLKARVITPADATNIERQVDNVKAGLDIAQGLEAATTGSGATKLQQALAALTAVQTYLASKQGSTTP